jgi:hypothetical protein
MTRDFHNMEPPAPYEPVEVEMDGPPPSAPWPDEQEDSRLPEPAQPERTAAPRRAPVTIIRISVAAGQIIRCMSSIPAQRKPCT